MGSASPATYKGNASNNTSAGGWAPATSYGQGTVIRPSPGTGQVFLAIEGGVSGGAQPAWSGPAFPTIGTQFTDNTVTWMCLATEPGPWAPVLQLPVDSDPPLAFGQVIPESTLADQMAWITANAGMLTSNNTWTGNQKWTGTSLWQSNASGAFEIDGVLTYGGGGNYSSIQGIANWYAAIFFGVYGQGDSNAPLNGLESPAALGQARLLLEKWRTTNSTYARWYADTDPPFSTISESGLTLTVNAKWGFPGWTQDDATEDSMLYSFGTAQFECIYWPAGTSFSSAAVYIDGVFKTGFQGIEINFPVYANAGLQVSGGDLDVESGHNVNVVSGNITAGAQLRGASARVTGATETGTLVVDSAITEVGGVTTAGYGVPLVLPGGVQNVSVAHGSGPVNVGPAFTVGSHYYKFIIQLYDNAGQIDPSNFEFFMLFSSDSIYPATLGPIQNDSGHAAFQWNDSSNDNGFAELSFFPSPNVSTETVQLQISQAGGSGTTLVTAQLILIA